MPPRTHAHSDGAAITRRVSGDAVVAARRGVAFNQQVKVLGYVLSDDERALKQRWSAENHERMLAFKQTVRRARVQQRFRDSRRPAAALSNFDIALEAHDLDGDMQQRVAYVRAQKQKQIDERRRRIRPRNAVSAAASAAGDEAPLLRARTVEVRLQPAPTEETPRLAHGDNDDGKDCEQWSATLAAALALMGKRAAESLRALDRKIGADWLADSDALACLRNLFIPDVTTSPTIIA